MHETEQPRNPLMCIFSRFHILGNENAFEGLMLTLLRTLVYTFDWRQQKTIALDQVRIDF